MRPAEPGEQGATLLKAVALVVLVLGLLCLFHGVDHDELAGSLCAGTVIVSVVVLLDPSARSSRRFRPAPAFSLYGAIPHLPDPPPKVRPV